MQLGIFQEKVALAHGALHFHDAVAHQAAHARARFRPVHNLLDRCIEQAAVEQRGVVAARAPFGGAHTGNVLHVFDALAIPLIIERRKMVHRAVPLGVNVRVAALARFRFHEVLRRNVAAVFGLGRTGKEFPRGAVAFAIHGVGRHEGIDDAIRLGIAPAYFTRPPHACRYRCGQERQCRESRDTACKCFAQPSSRIEPSSREQERPGNTQSDMSKKPSFQAKRRPNFDQNTSEKSTRHQQHPAEARYGGFNPKQAHEVNDKEDGQNHPGRDM